MQTKTWGGKGHKQKGASLAGAVIGVKELQTKGGTKMKQWEKAPSEILAKHLKVRDAGFADDDAPFTPQF